MIATGSPPPEPFADWQNERGEILFIRPEECRKCSGQVLVGYHFTHGGIDCRWTVKPLVHRRVQTIHLGEDRIGGFGPLERCGVLVVLGDVAVDRGLQVHE